MANCGKYSMRTCKICGREYYGYQTSNYCGPDCQRERARRQYYFDRERKNAMRIAREHAKKMKEENTSGSLVDIAVEAKKAGMSYGQYVAKMGL